MSDGATIDRPALPDAQAAERGFLGTVLNAPEIMEWAHEYLVATEFQSPFHARLFMVAQDARENKYPLDQTTIIAALGETPTRQVFPGYTVQQYLTHLFTSVTIDGDPDAIGEKFAEEIARIAEQQEEQQQQAAPAPAEDHPFAELPPPQSTLTRFKLKPFKDVKLAQRARYLVRNIIPQTGIMVVWGPPKCGKSFWLFDLLMHVALGWSYRGKTVQQGTVVYLVLEGDEGFSDRAVAFRQHWLKDHKGDVPFFVISTKLALVTDYNDLIRDIKAQLPKGATVAAIAIDTLNRSMRGSESNDQDMTAYVNAADAVKEAFNCAVPIIHHSGVDGERPRGHTSLTGAVDCQVKVKRNEARNVVATVEYMKDGIEGEEIISNLLTLTIGREESGEDITSCVVEAVDKKLAGKGKKLTDAQYKFMECVFAALNDFGVPTAAANLPNLPKTVNKVVDFKHIRAIFHARTPQTDEDDEKHTSRTRTHLSRSSKDMQSARVVGFQAPFMWFTGIPLQGFLGTQHDISVDESSQPAMLLAPGEDFDPSNFR
jgi:hypothetical protein